MAESRGSLYVVGALACGALAVAIHATVRADRLEARLAAPPPGSACVDGAARADLDDVRRSMSQRDAALLALARRAESGPERGAAIAAVDSPASPTAGAVSPPAGPRHYARVEVANPAVSVTQKADGSFDVRTTDRSLAGTVVRATGITPDEQRHEMLIAVPASD